MKLTPCHLLLHIWALTQSLVTNTLNSFPAKYKLDPHVTPQPWCKNQNYGGLGIIPRRVSPGKPPGFGKDEPP